MKDAQNTADEDTSGLLKKKPWTQPAILSREMLESIAGLCSPGLGKTQFDGTPACNLNPNS